MPSSDVNIAQLALLAIKLDKKPEYLERRVAFAKKYNATEVYFMQRWCSLEQAEAILQIMQH